MSQPKPRFSVNVDVTNPGQFFACCGLLELSHRLWRGAEGWFDEDTFHVAVMQDVDASARILLTQLAKAAAHGLPGSSDPKLPPVWLRSPFNLRLDWWLDSGGDKTILGKLFAGQKRTLTDVHRLQGALAKAIEKDQREREVFGWAAPLRGRFGVDPRAAWDALHVGFSPKERRMTVATYIVVELAGAIGLQSFRPKVEQDLYLYATWITPLSACVARPVAAGIIPTAVHKRYRFALTTRGRYKGFDFATPIGDES